jgi:hypothetical protein
MHDLSEQNLQKSGDRPDFWSKQNFYTSHPESKHIPDGSMVYVCSGYQLCDVVAVINEAIRRSSERELCRRTTRC